MARPAENADQPVTLTEWLRGRTDPELAGLLRRRPDLGLPAPPDFATLASRVSVRSSVQRAVDSLDAWALRVLEALALSTGLDGRPVRAGAEALLPGVDLAPALAELRGLALIWGEQDLHFAAGVPDALGQYPAGLGRPGELLSALTGQPWTADTAAALQELIGSADPAELDVLRKLASGPPVGLVRDTRQAAVGDPAPAGRLLARGLLIPIDGRTVELPREVGLALRGANPLGDVASVPPPIEASDRSPAGADRAGTTAVLDLLRLVEALAELWSRAPAAILRSGGIGVRELRRTARALGVGEPLAALVIEIAASAGLVATGNGIDPVYLPTSDYDAWRRHEPAQRWTPLGAAWLGMSRQPSLVGQRDERERVITVLGPDVERGTIAPLRRTILGVLATLPPGAAPGSRETVLARLSWQSPRRSGSQRPLAETLLSEADLVGLTAAGGLTGYGRALLAGSASATEHALTIALPEPVDHFLLQPDLTLVVPGPPVPELARELELTAELESSGGASVYRITEASVRRALDAGRSGSELTELFAAHTRTPVPQALSYLVEDVSRRHGVLRAGVASAYLRCDDEALLGRVVADRAVDALGLRRLAPTIVVSAAPVSRLLDVLREAGYAPAAEAAGGGVLTLAVESPRAPSRQTSRLVRPKPAGDQSAHVAELVRRIRSGDSLSELARRAQPIGQQIPGITSASTLGLLREAIRGGRRIWLDFAGGDGTCSQHTIVPISLAGGFLRGHESSTQRLQSYPLHRIMAVSVLTDDA